jgi:hypothetical protein
MLSMQSLFSILNQNQIDAQAVVSVLKEGIKMERLNRDAQRLTGNHQEYLNSELKIAQAELFLHALRYGDHTITL